MRSFVLASYVINVDRVFRDVYPFSRGNVYRQVRGDEWPHPPLVLARRRLHVSIGSVDLFCEDIRPDQGEAGTLPGQRRGAMRRIAGQHYPAN